MRIRPANDGERDVGNVARLDEQTCRLRKEAQTYTLDAVLDQGTSQADVFQGGASFDATRSAAALGFCHKEQASLRGAAHTNNLTSSAPACRSRGRADRPEHPGRLQ